MDRGCADREARDTAEGREIAYLFLANIDMIDGHLGATGKHFEDSLRLNPDFLRARFGWAEVVFQQALTECEASPTSTSRTTTMYGCVPAAPSTRRPLRGRGTPSTGRCAAR